MTSRERDQVLPRALSPARIPKAPFAIRSTTMAALGEDLLATVNKLQDLVFNTIGNDSLDLPQIVGFAGSSVSSYQLLVDSSCVNVV